MLFSEYADYFLEDASYDSMVAVSDRELESVVLESTIDYSMNHYLTESEKESLWSKFKKFLAAALESFHHFVADFKRKIQDTIQKKQLKKKLTKLKETLQKEQAAGKKTIEYEDFISYKRLYIKSVDNMKKVHKRMVRMKYKTVDQLEEDFKTFEKLLTDFEKQEKEILSKKKEFPIKTMISFVENEINGDSEVMKTLNVYDSLIADMRSDVKLMERKATILGDDIIPHKIGILRRVLNMIGRFIKKTVVRFVTNIIFIFA